MYPKYKSKFGYQIGNNQTDSYGVDHSGFTLQDEVAYQFAREEKENVLLEQLKKTRYNFKLFAIRHQLLG